ncbi:MAG: hypothetical protein ABF646_11095 [Acetobacter papayae]
MTDQKPTGVFVGAPARSPVAVPNTQVEGQGMPVVAFANSNMPIKAISFVSDIFEVSDRRTEGFNIPLVRQSDAQAKIAALEAEVVQLRNDLTSSKRQNFNAGYLIACCNIANMHNEESIASDVLAEASITESDVKALDLSEYDANALAEIRKARSEDPILKGSAA